MMKIRKPSRDSVIGMLLLCVCLFTYFVIIPREVGGEIQRGLPPEFFPNFAVIFVGIFSIFLILKDYYPKTADFGSEETPVQKKQGRKGLGYSMIACLIYIILCHLIGYNLSTFVMLAVFMWIYNERRWVFLIGIPGIIIAVNYLIFALLMEVRLPKGMFFE